jgi:hypothetical protein
MTNLVLASGPITNQDEITIALVEPADGTPLLVRGHWPLRPTTSAATHYPAVAAAITRSSPNPLPPWHGLRRTASERRRSVSRSPPRIRRTACNLTQMGKERLEALCKAR